MWSQRLAILSLSLGLGGCFNIPLSSKGKLDLSDSAGRVTQAISRTQGAEKEVATIDPDSKTDVQLTTPKVDGLVGATVSIQPGSLAISVDVVVEQASEFSDTSITGEMGLADDIQVAAASPGMIIRPSENVDLKRPLTLAMPLPASMGFRLQGGSKYGVFYKYFDPTSQKLVTGLKVVDGTTVKLSFDSVSGKDVLSFDGYFGAYWAAILTREVTAAEVPPPKPAEEPIINKAKVAVIQNSGVVKETEIVKTQAIPEIVWSKPTIKFNADMRMISVVAAIPANQKVSACKVDLFESPTAKSGISLETPLGPSVDYILTNPKEHSLVGRFRCTDAQSRVTITPWTDVVTIPGVSPYSPENALCDDRTPAIRAVGPAPGNGLYYLQDIPRTGTCKYSGKVFIREASNFFLSSWNGDYTCGLATHNLQIGEQTLSCERTTQANVGNNHLSLQGSNYNVTIDFSQSKAKPKLTLSLIPCDKGDMYLQTGYTLSASTPPTEAMKMVHKGACEFEKTFATLPWSGSENITLRNLSGSFTCGDDAAQPQLSADSWHYNVCGSGTFRKFSAGSYTQAIAHHFRIRLGDSLSQDYGGTYESEVRYTVDSNCPDRLYLSSAGFGLTPIENKNILYRNQGCRYLFSSFTNNTTPGIYDYKIKTLDGSRVCGGVANGSMINIDCSANAPTIAFTGELDKVYQIDVQGDAVTGQLSTATVTSYTPNCNGFYLQNVSVGYQNTEATTMNEVAPCLFEKIWTKSSTLTGFYLTDSSNFVNSIDWGSNQQPSINGAESLLFGYQDATNVPKITPLNAVNGTSYRIVVDARTPGNPKLKVQSYTAPAGNCSEDLYLTSTGLGLDYVDPSNRFHHDGDCNYSYTVNNFQDSSAYFNFRIVNTTTSLQCGYGGGNSMPYYNGTERSSTPLCSGNVDSYSLNIYGHNAFRIFVKKDSSGNLSRMVLRDLSAPYKTWILMGDGANGLTFAQTQFQAPQYSNTSVRERDLIWTINSPKSFFLKDDSSFNFCFPAANYGALQNSAMGMNCRYAQTPPTQFFGPYNPGTYRIRIVQSDSIESPIYVYVSPYQALASWPGVQPLTTLANIGTGLAPDSSNNGSVLTNPGGLSKAATWTAPNGDLYLFGGEGLNNARYNSLWKYAPGTSTWWLVDGDHSPDQYSVISGTLRPGARAYAMSWVDAPRNRLYLFGGWGFGNGNSGALADLWYWDLNNSTWNFVKGSHDPSYAGIFPALNQAGVNVAGLAPPSLYSAATFVDANNTFWMFGGRDTAGSYNDLWKFVPSADSGSAAGDWVWMGGLQAVNATPNDSNWPEPRTQAAAWMDNNTLYIYGGSGYTIYNDLWSYSIASASWSQKQTNSPAGIVVWENLAFHPSNRPFNTVDMKPITWVKAGGQLMMFHQGNFWVYNTGMNAWALAGQNSSVYVELSPATTEPAIYSPTLDPANRVGQRHEAMGWQSPAGLYIYGGYTSSYYYPWNDLWKIVP